MPEAGDFVWMDFDPQSGHEQGGHRPALVLSPALYNGKSGLALVCPVTSRPKGYTFEVGLPANPNVNGVVLADHLRSADWRARRATFAGRAADDVLQEVRARLAPLLGFE